MLIKSPFFWRAFLGYMIVGLVGTFLFAASLIGRSGKHARDELDRNMEVTSELLVLTMAPLLRTLDVETIRSATANVGEESGLRVTIVDSTGLVLADTHEDPIRMNNHLRRPEIQSALISGSGRAQRYSFTLEENFSYLARTVYQDGQPGGFVRVAKAMSVLTAEIRAEETLVLRNAGIMAFLVLLLGYYLAARQAGRVDQLTGVAEAIAAGNFARRIPESNSVGLKRLAEAINILARTSARGATEVTADRNRLSTIFTCMVEGVIDVDMDQKILHINEAAARLLSVNEKQCIGKPLWQEIRNQEIIGALDEALSTLSVIKTQMRLARESGQRVVDIYAASLSDDGGEPIGAVLVLHDITELKNLERVRTDFVANASHELKTPITAIRGLTETILEDSELDKETLLHFIERVHAQSLRLSQLVGDLMTISRLESAQGSKDFDLINFGDLVTQAVNTAKATAVEKGHQLSLTMPTDKVSVYGDRQNLSQLLDNLIDNAIKYTPEPGVIQVALDMNDEEVTVSVRDNGVGISPQYQQRVFERFYRVDKVRSQSLGGTGLGLSIVKNIAEKHGGSVSVESQLGNGSTFIFRIPRASQKSSAA